MIVFDKHLLKENEMTVNTYVKCPICGCVTRIRSVAGYVY